MTKKLVLIYFCFFIKDSEFVSITTPTNLAKDVKGLPTLHESMPREAVTPTRYRIIQEEKTPSYIDDPVMHVTTMVTSDDLINQDTSMVKSDDLITKVTMVTSDDLVNKDTPMVTSDDFINQDTSMVTSDDLINQDTSMITSDDHINQDTSMVTSDDLINQDKTFFTPFYPMNQDKTISTTDNPKNQDAKMSSPGEPSNQKKTFFTSCNSKKVLMTCDPNNQETKMSTSNDMLKQERIMSTDRDIKLDDAEIHSVKKAFKKGTSVFVSKDVDKNESKRDTTNQHNKIDACKDRCGQDTYIPCSCSKKCLVYRNCCEDFNETCLHIFQQGKREFSDLLNLETECTRESYLVISGCSKMLPVSFMQSNTSDNDTSDEEKHTLNETIYALHVTDRTSGLTFKNISVLKCNQLKNSFPLKWSANFKNLNINIYGSAITKIHDENMISSFSPPADFDIAVPRCISSSVGTCELDFRGPPEIEKWCRAFKSYVTLTGNDTLYYNNRYCAQCNSHDEFLPVSVVTLAKHDFTFSIIGSFTDRLVTFSALHSSKLVWSKLQCYLSENIPEVWFPDHYRCEIVSCAAGYDKRPDGQCKQLHVLRFGFTIGAFSFIESQDLSRIIRCLLSAYTDFEAIGEWQPFQSYYDQRLKKVVQSVELSVYVTEEILSKLKESLTVYYDTIVTIVKKLKNIFIHRPYQSLAKVDIFGPIKSADLRVTAPNLLENVDFINSVNPSKITACLCIVSMTKVDTTTDAPCTTQCIHFQDFQTLDSSLYYEKSFQQINEHCLQAVKSTSQLDTASVQHIVVCLFLYSSLFMLSQ